MISLKKTTAIATASIITLTGVIPSPAHAASFEPKKEDVEKALRMVFPDAPTYWAWLRDQGYDGDVVGNQ